MKEQKPAARILIADDHRLLADACKSLLEPEFQVIGIVTDGRCLVRSAVELKPDIVILDIYMPQLNGLDAAEQVKRKLPGVKLVFLTMTMSADVAAEAFRRGASAFVLKQSAGDELLLAVRKVKEGLSYLSPLLAKETVMFLQREQKDFGQEKGSTAARGGDVDERSGKRHRHNTRHRCISQIPDDGNVESKNQCGPP
jgi:DNA-binding NarL/FixJ family response regulator